MKIVLSFLFSEEFEADLLYLNLLLSDALIDQWIICENEYSHQGDFKGLHLKKIINNDERFKQFKQKITVLEGSRLFHKIDKNLFQDKLSFECENWQRSLAYKYFTEQYDDQDWILIHDVDEMPDFSHQAGKSEFLKKAENVKNEILLLPRMRYVFDFDNRYMPLYSTVACRKSYLKRYPTVTLSHLREKYNNVIDSTWQHFMVFEYSSCYDTKHIVRKLDTNAHTHFKKEDLEVALKHNHRLIKPYNLKFLRPNETFFFEKAVLDETNSPRWVRENLDKIKTNNVNLDYQRNRTITYPQFYDHRYVFLRFKDYCKNEIRSFRRKTKYLKIKVRRLLNRLNPRRPWQP